MDQLNLFDTFFKTWVDRNEEQEWKDYKELCSPSGIKVMKQTHTPNNTKAALISKICSH